ncbi:MAG: SDR family NAD(P)-dependent oxidoreductase [Bacteroidota bacterium]
MKRNYALVTGGSSGIGQSACVKLAACNYNILINYNRNEAGALETKRLVEEQNVEAELLQFDVSNADNVREVLGTWIDSHPDQFIEILVNNAGSRNDNLMIFTSNEEWHKVLDLNLSSFFYVTKPVVKKMILRKSGSIINISSLSGVKGWQGQVPYAAAKSGLIGASKSLAKELGRKNIRVNVITPGFIKTKMIADLKEEEYQSKTVLQRFGRPDEVGEMIAFLGTDKASFISGQVISIDGGDFLH